MDLLKSLFKGDKVIWMIFLTLCLISVIEVFSAASMLAYKSGDHWRAISQHCFYLMLGAGVVIAVHKMPCKLFRLIPVLTLPASLVLLPLTMFLGQKVNGAGRWLEVFGVQFQPSELGKMAVVTSTALILSMMQEERGAHPRAFKLVLVITGVICLLIAPENFSTAGMLFGVSVLLMFVGRVSLKQLGRMFAIIVLVLGVSGTAVAVTPDEVLDKVPGMHRVTTWKHRIQNFLDGSEVSPQEYDIDKDAQVAHANIAIATSNLIGKMPGNSVERDFLSQAFSDFIFAIIIEELGLFGGAFVVFLYIILLIRVGGIARKCPKKYLSFLIIGLALLLVCQALVNMMVAVGLFPVTGQPLPLISKGGTSTLINCAYIGIILGVSRYVEEYMANQDLQLEEVDDEGEEQALVCQCSDEVELDN